MGPSLVVLKLLLDEIGQGLDLSRFEERLKLQKRLYLLQLANLDLGYRFGWYLRGPYCRELTRDAFALKEHLDSSGAGQAAMQGKELAPHVKEKVGMAVKIWKPVPENASEAQWLELLASLHYLRHIAYLRNDRNRGFPFVYSRLAKDKPRFKDKKVLAHVAWQRLDCAGLIAKKVLSG
jgi:uncharacterized protein YwgA